MSAESLCACLYRPEAEKGAWNAQNVRFFKPVPLTSFGVASFVPEGKAGGPIQDPGSINVRSSSRG